MNLCAGVASLLLIRRNFFCTACPIHWNHLLGSFGLNTAKQDMMPSFGKAISRRATSSSVHKQSGCLLNSFRLSYVYIRTKFPNRCDSCTYIYVHGLCDRNMGLLTDTLRYHHTTPSTRGIHVLPVCSRQPFYSMFTNGRKVEFTRSCPLFLASFGKLRLSDQVQSLGMEYNGALYGFSAVKVKLVDSLI